MSITIETRGLSKSFNKNVILENVNLQWESGKVYGLIGRNGSGKTLLLRMLCGLVPVSSGEVIINGVNITKKKCVPQDIGAVIESPLFLPKFSGYKNLCFLADLRKKIDKSRVRKTMSFVGLDPSMRRHVEKYSLGMRQRLGIAQAVMEEPSILILDEPMNGLDAQGADLLHLIIKCFCLHGRTVVLASHMIEDVMSTCDMVYRVQDGHVLPVSKDSPSV